MENVIITTTINIPTFLEGICKNLKKYKHRKDKNSIIVIGDLKTPKEALGYCNKLSKKFGYKILFMDIKFQNKFFLKKYKKLYKFFPLNDAVRKLLGSIYLFDNLPDKVVFIDDDNYVDKNKNFLRGHSLTNSKVKIKTIYSNDKWPNLYKYFKERSDVPFYPRGFPWKNRKLKANKFKIKFIEKKIIANCGYILGDPDIDATSRLFWPIETLKVKSQTHFALSNENFFPLNDQNTSVGKSYIPLYFKPLAGGRNSDIWTSYLLEKVAYKFNETVSYGPPIITQIRNKHDYWKDYELEKEHNISTDLFAEILEKIKLKSKSNRVDTFIELCKSFKDSIEKMLKVRKKNLKKIRHYQAISNIEIDERRKKSLIYIYKYIAEYENWLFQIKKTFKNKNVN
tara:strand:- start:907 stop:2100 length:1194 start_codon:yes stop_codon:yes gene_type:complete